MSDLVRVNWAGLRPVHSTVTAVFVKNKIIINLRTSLYVKLLKQCNAKSNISIKRSQATNTNLIKQIPWCRQEAEKQYHSRVLLYCWGTYALSEMDILAGRAAGMRYFVGHTYNISWLDQQPIFYACQNRSALAPTASQVIHSPGNPSKL